MKFNPQYTVYIFAACFAFVGSSCDKESTAPTAAKQTSLEGKYGGNIKGEIEKFIYPTDSTPARMDTTFFDSTVVYTVVSENPNSNTVLINNKGYALDSNLSFTYSLSSRGGTTLEKVYFRNDSLFHSVRTNAGGDYYLSDFRGKRIE
jgi:hypothetical protein